MLVIYAKRDIYAEEVLTMNHVPKALMVIKSTSRRIALVVKYAKRDTGVREGITKEAACPVDMEILRIPLPRLLLVILVQKDFTVQVLHH